MSDPLTIKIKSRLSKLVFRPGGIAVQDAIRRAEAAVEANFGAYLASIDSILVELDSSYGPNATSPAGGDCKRLYALASNLIDLSICLRDSGVDQAARALCDLSDLSANAGKWDQQAVEVHINVLKLLRYTGVGMTEAQRDGVIDGLKRVARRRFGDGDGDTPLAEEDGNIVTLKARSA